MAQDLHRRAVALFDRGCALHGRQEFEAAISCYTEAIALDPNYAAPYSNRGAAFAALNRCDEALASLDRAIGLVPDYPEAHFSRAVTLLLKGDLLAGWIDFEWRWKTAPGRALRQSKNFERPLWLGEEAVADKRVLLYTERGLGDTLQFCRYAPMVSQLQAKVILQVQRPLAALLRRLEGDIHVVAEGETLPGFDFHCPLLSLPLVFETALDTIPAPRRYLSAQAIGVARLRARLASRGSLRGGSRNASRVGLVWRGDVNNPDDRNRSIALRDVLRFLPPELEYFSLQKEVTPQERALIESHPRFRVISEDLDFEATAALCECLDLVISIDSSVAHLAAALGMPTWILLPFNPDCRWLLERGDSPWYPSARLFRQTRLGEWHSVLARLRGELEPLLDGRESAS
jgi:hypothetical protein